MECKRVHGSWIFLLPNHPPDSISRSKVLHIEYSKPPVFKWEDFRLTPESYKTTFCVMDVEGKRDNRTIEKYFGDLLLSLEGIAVEETNILSTTLHYQHHQAYLPMIITTANLQVCFVNPKDIGAEDGNSSLQSEIKPVSFIRFRKNLAGNLQYEGPLVDNLRKSTIENERTIMIVQAKSILDYFK